jgi:DNA-directed RNA polymerase specialized sigma24 family protein
MALSPGEPDPSAEPLRRWQEQGDLDALNELLRTEIHVLKHMIRGRRFAPIAGSAGTSDIAQEAVLRMLKAKTAPSFDDPRALRAYLWRSAWHLLVTRYETRRDRPLEVDLVADSGLDRFLAAAPAFDDLDRAERGAAIGFAMNLLSREDREMIRRVYYDGEDIATAGAAVGLPRAVANTRIVRARRLLASRLSEWSDLIG